MNSRTFPNTKFLPFKMSNSVNCSSCASVASATSPPPTGSPANCGKPKKCVTFAEFTQVSYFYVEGPMCNEYDKSTNPGRIHFGYPDRLTNDNIVGYLSEDKERPRLAGCSRIKDYAVER